MDFTRIQLITGILQEDKELMELAKEKQYLALLAYLNGHGFSCSMQELEEILDGMSKPESRTGRQHSRKETGNRENDGKKKVRGRILRTVLIAAALMAVLASLVLVLLAFSWNETDEPALIRFDDSSVQEKTVKDSEPGSQIMTDPAANSDEDNVVESISDLSGVEGSVTESDSDNLSPSGETSPLNESSEADESDDVKEPVSEPTSEEPSDVPSSDNNSADQNPGGQGSTGNPLVKTGLSATHAQDDKIIVTLEPEGGKLSDRKLTVEYRKTYGKLPVPTDGPGSFAGWFLHPDDGTEKAWWYLYADRVTANTVVDEEDAHILYAHWTKQKQSATFIQCCLESLTAGDSEWNGVGPLQFRIGETIGVSGWALYEDGFERLIYKVNGREYTCDLTPVDRADMDSTYGSLSYKNGKGAGFGTEKDLVLLEKIREMDAGTYTLELFAESRNGNRDRIELFGNEKVQFEISNYGHEDWLSAAVFNGHRYKLYLDIVSWTAAEEECEKMGGHLVCITSKEEQEFIMSLTGGNVDAWMGAYADDNNQWRWVTGEEWDYTNWLEGEPNGFPHERYGVVWPQTWNDLCVDSCEQSAYICEWE